MNSNTFDCSEFSFPSEEESSKTIFKLKQKIQKLTVVNGDLYSKNQILTEQIERALKMNSNIEETFKNHNNTVKELIAVRAEKDDLENRLRLSLQANEELKIRLRKYCNENASNNSKEDFNSHESSISGINKKTSLIQSSPLSKELNTSQINELKKQISVLEKQNSDLSEQIIEMSQAQDRFNNNPQLNRQSSELFDNTIMSPNQRNNYDDIDSNISLRNERDKMMNLLNRQNDLTSTLELRLRKANSDIEELREKNRNLTKDVMKKQQLSDSTEVKIPDSVFSSPEFPLDLENMVSGIYKNPTLSITTKIRQIISVITHYFKSKYEQIERDLKESKENVFKLTEKTNSLIDFLHKIFPCKNVNYNALLDDENTRNLLKDAVFQLKDELKSAKQDKIQLEQQYAEIAKKMKTGSFQEMANSIENLQLEHKEFKQFKKEAQFKEDELVKTIKELQTAKKELIKINKALEDNIEKQKIRAKTLKDEFENQIKSNDEASKQEIEKIKSQLDITVTSLNQQHSNQINELNNKFENELKAKDKDIDELKQENSNLKTEIIDMTKRNNDQMNDISSQRDNLTQDIDKLKYVIKHLRIKKEKREKEIELLKQQNEDNQNEIKERLKTQKNEIQSRIEQLQQLRSKEAKENSQNIENLNSEIEQLVKERNELLVNNTTLSIQVQKLETKINALSSDRERERREYDSRMMALRNAAQTEVLSKTEEIKSQFLEKKHDLYQSLFKQLAPLLSLNISSNFSDNNVGTLIIDIRKKLETILARESRIREILNINSYESIEEALAKKMKHFTRKKTRIEL